MQNRRERIAERMKALQELVPDSNKVIELALCLNLDLLIDFRIGYVDVVVDV